MRESTHGLLAGALALGACCGLAVAQPVPAAGPAPALEREPVPAQRSTHVSPGLGIDPADLPSPGRCRVWIPGRSPESQPRPGHCRAVGRRVPAGAWLVHRPTAEPGLIRVTVNDPRPVYVASVRLYEAETGRFVREE